MSFSDLKKDSRKYDKFIKLCGMLGSSYDGEIANAASKATALLREFGATWSDVINGNSCNVHNAQRFQNEIDRLTRINLNINKDNRDLREKLASERNKNYELNSKMHQLRNKLTDIEESIAQQQKNTPHVWIMEKDGKAKIRIPKDDIGFKGDAWRVCAKALCDEDLTDWEAGFIESILQRSSLSEKQINVLHRMMDKYGV